MSKSRKLAPSNKHLFGWIFLRPILAQHLPMGRPRNCFFLFFFKFGIKKKRCSYHTWYLVRRNERYWSVFVIQTLFSKKKRFHCHRSYNVKTTERNTVYVLAVAPKHWFYVYGWYMAGTDTGCAECRRVERTVQCEQRKTHAVKRTHVSAAVLCSVKEPRRAFFVSVSLIVRMEYSIKYEMRFFSRRSCRLTVLPWITLKGRKLPVHRYWNRIGFT